jgi:hypothetical protein
MRRRTILSGAAFFAIAPILRAAAVRGRLVRTGPNQQRVPASGITVTLASKARPRTAPSVTQQDGMYYLNAPAGPYSLEVWVRGRANPPVVYPIQVKEPYTDIPAITLP